MNGKDLLEHVVSATELPQAALLKELSRLLQNANCDENNVSLEELRSILADYAQEVLLEAQTAYSKKAG